MFDPKILAFSKLSKKMRMILSVKKTQKADKLHKIDNDIYLSGFFSFTKNK